MAKWQRKLKLYPEWDQASDDAITFRALAAVVAERLRALAPFGGAFADLDDKRDELADEFEWIAKSEDSTVEDFDGWMDDLYDWADTRLDGDWNGKKVCWVDRFTPQVAPAT